MRPSTIFRACKVVRFSQCIWITGMRWICSILGQQTLTSNTQAKSEKTKDLHRAMKHVLSWSTTHSLLFNVRDKLRLSKYFYPKDFLLIERDDKRRNVCWTTIDIHCISLSLLLSSDSPTEARSCEVIERALRAPYWHKHIRLYRLLVQIGLVLFNGRSMSVHVCVCVCVCEITPVDPSLRADKISDHLVCLPSRSNVDGFRPDLITSIVWTATG